MTAAQFLVNFFLSQVIVIVYQAREIMQGLKFSDIVMYVGTINLCKFSVEIANSQLFIMLIGYSARRCVKKKERGFFEESTVG